MSKTVEIIKAQLTELSTAERVELAAFLLDMPETDEHSRHEWRSDVARRVADIRSGTASGRSVDEVVAELRGRNR